MDTAQIIVSIAASLLGGGAVSGLAAWRRSKSQNDLDLSDAWSQLVTPLIERLDALEKEVKLLKKDRVSLVERIRLLEAWARRLVNQIRDAGLDPVPMLPCEEGEEEDV